MALASQCRKGSLFLRNVGCEQFEQPHCVIRVIAGGAVLEVLQSHGTSWGPDRP